MAGAVAQVPADFRARLSADEHHRLEVDGCLHLRAVLAPPALAAMHEAWDRLWQEELRAGSGSGSGSNLGPSGLEKDAAFAACLAHPRVMSAVAALLDADVHLRSLHGRAPPQGHGRQGLHVDWSTPVDPGHQLLANAFWVLDDMDAGNGATRLVPGTHRARQVPRGPVAQPHGSHPRERSVQARAGDVVVASSHVWHGGGSNSSGRRRRVVIAQFSRATLPGPG
jgi:hypothetical protein